MTRTHILTLTALLALAIIAVAAFHTGLDMGDAIAGKNGVGGYPYGPWGFNLDMLSPFLPDLNSLDAIAGKSGVGGYCIYCG